MPRPLIGITAGRRNQAAAADDIQAVTVGVPIEYVECVAAAGGAPVLVPRVPATDCVPAVLERLDGLLLSGGGDVVSLRFGEAPHPSARGQDPVLDETECALTQEAWRRGLPVFGICRGIQVLNVALGGTLIQDIPSQVRGSHLHWTRARDSALVHLVEFAADSILARLLGPQPTAVNSFHHQAVKDVAPGLQVTARAGDGVIEGLEATDGRPVLAVQFHPEDCAATYPRFSRLFEWFVAAARGRREQAG